MTHQQSAGCPRRSTKTGTTHLGTINCDYDEHNNTLDKVEVGSTFWVEESAQGVGRRGGVEKAYGSDDAGRQRSKPSE